MPCTVSSANLARPLVLAGGGLASLQLLEVPVADLEVALVVVHALGELLRGRGTVAAEVLCGRLLLGCLNLLLLRLCWGR